MSTENNATEKPASKEDPHITAGIPNWVWLLLFVVLAATPVANVVRSWTTPSPTTYQTTPPATAQIQNPTSKATTEAENKLSTLEARLEDLKEAEKRLSVLEARLDDTYSTVEAVGFSAGLFGVLITVITLFFALKESERVKDAMNRIDGLESALKSQKAIQDLVDAATADVNAAKADASFALSQARTAKDTARLAINEADSAQTTVRNVHRTATDATLIATGAAKMATDAEERAKSAEKLAQLILSVKDQTTKIEGGDGNNENKMPPKDSIKLQLIANAKSIAKSSNNQYLIDAADRLSISHLDQALQDKLQQVRTDRELAAALGVQI